MVDIKECDSGQVTTEKITITIMAYLEKPQYMTNISSMKKQSFKTKSGTITPPYRCELNPFELI